MTLHYEIYSVQKGALREKRETVLASLFLLHRLQLQLDTRATKTFRFPRRAVNEGKSTLRATIASLMDRDVGWSPGRRPVPARHSAGRCVKIVRELNPSVELQTKTKSAVAIHETFVF